MKKLPTYLITTVSYKPNHKLYTSMWIGVAVSCLIVTAAAATLLFGDLILDFWRL